MDFVDLVSDLEEGEILDDSPSSSSSEKKIRELPQRYIIREKITPIQKHKKDCKYAIRYHAKKLTKMKKTPKSKDSSKRYHKSVCHHDKSHKLPDKSSKNLAKNFSKNGYSNSSLIEEIKSSLKDPFLETQQIQHNFENSISDTQSFTISVCNLAEIGRKNDFQPENSIVYLEKNCPPVFNINNLGNYDKEKTDSHIKVPSNLTRDKSLPTKNEESEDEEELRRIALATCSKRKVTTDSSANLVQSVNRNCVLSIPEFLENNDINISHQKISLAPDNYEIVDMEVDEDIQTSIEVLDTAVKDHNSEPMENVYVIDTKPFSDLERGIQKNVLSEAQSHNSSDEDFETDILRAELIGNLYEKKDEYIEEQKTRVDNHPKQAPLWPKKKNIGNFKKSNFSFYRKQLRSSRNVLRKTIINNKCENLSHNIKKTIVTNQVNKPAERLIIALNEESSSENSDTENPVASIEALISDCRQKSSVLSTDKTEETVTLVPKAVSYLSKSQQEEYTSLMKILAEKEKLQVPSNQVQPKNESLHLQIHSLKRLEENLLGCKNTLEKKKEFMAHLHEEMTSKKLLFMKSKLTAEHLKEQYVAAEKITKVNYMSFSKSYNDYKSGKKTVSNLESKINELQSLLSKLGASIELQT